MDSGAPLTVALDLIRAQVLTGFGLVQGDVNTLFNTLVAMSVLIALLTWWADGRPKAGIDFLVKYIGFVILSLLIANFRAAIDALNLMAVGAGLKAGGSDLNPDAFFDPGRISLGGLSVVRPIREHIDTLLGWWQTLPNLPEIIFYLIMMAVIIGCFVIMAVQVFLTVLEFLFLGLACYIVAPFAVWNRSSFIAERAMGYITATAVKLLVLALVFSVSSAVIAGFRWSDEPAIDEATGMLALVLAIFYIVWRVPNAAAGMINGGPVFSAADAFHSLAGAMRLSHAVGSAATQLGWAGLAAGAAGIQAGLQRFASSGSGVRGATPIGAGPAGPAPTPFGGFLGGPGGGGGGPRGGGTGNAVHNGSTINMPGGRAMAPVGSGHGLTPGSSAHRFAHGAAGTGRRMIEAPTIEGQYEIIN